MMKPQNMFAWLLKPGTLPLIFLIFALTRAAVLLVPITPISDALWYVGAAARLSQGEGYSEGGIATAYWPPGWPIVLALIFKTFGVSILAAQLFNLACSVLAGWLTLDLGRHLFRSEAAARLGLLLLAIYPNSIGYVPLMLTEVFYTTLLLAGCWLLIARQSPASRVLAGVIFGVATLTKAQSLLVIPMIFGVAVLRSPMTIKHVASSVARALTVVLVALLVVAPWSYRNYQVFGEWVFVSTNGGLTLLTGNNPSARGGYSEKDPLVTGINRSVSAQLEVDKEARRLAKEWIQENPGRFMELIPLKAFRLWGPDGESEWSFQADQERYAAHALWFRAVRYANQAYYICLMSGFLWAGFLLLSRKAKLTPPRFDWWLLPYTLALYPTLIAMVFSGQSRFHYPVMPFVAMTCGWLLTHLMMKQQAYGSGQGRQVIQA
ncbi:glycosyltransferase family 39 protein [Zoogloea sp.]|uniref:ArnT family glycosyltransferase n=1 Tax=Zoogloea sp. TaxID=49181 RepID=UPI0025F22827|nr:glycosyltransferase family 39 protein [Zoogloea sp.]